jgi:hypothetical protein
MADKVFQIIDWAGATFNGNDLTTSVATIEPGLLVIKDAGANTVSLAASSGSAPLGFAYGERDLVYAPTSRLYATGEALVVVSGHGLALVSADFFTSGSIPPDAAGYDSLFAAADGKMDWQGTNKVARLVSHKDVTDPSGGTGTTNSLALIEFNIVP